jgi:polyhydroxyalkanoate synthesis regulator phasin
MAQRDLLKRYLDAGMAFTSMSKSRAEGIVRELMKAGEISRDQVQTQVDELIERSRRNTDHLVAIVRKEVTSQLGDLNKTIRDLERRLSGASAPAPAPADKTAPAKKAAKKAAAAKATATTSVDGPAPVKKARAGKKAAATPAAEVPASGAAVKKAPAKRAPARKAPAKRPAAKAPTAVGDTSVAVGGSEPHPPPAVTDSAPSDNGPGES